MSIEAAIRAVAASSIVADATSAAWKVNADRLRDMGANANHRLAAVIGQCSHESAGFRQLFENLNYSGPGLWKTFRKYFASPAEAEQFARQPERIANRVYANRLGNGNSASGDGWRYRGKGFLQLTGRANYRIYGADLGVDLEKIPERAAEPELAWLIAVRFMAKTRRSGRIALEWADVPDDTMVTLCINGGTNGWADRKILTAKALNALSGKVSVAELQSLLLSAGFQPGPIDGLMGKRTEAARKAAETAFGVSGDALIARLRTLAV